MAENKPCAETLLIGLNEPCDIIQNTDACSSGLIIGEDIGIVLNAYVSQMSNLLLFESCCNGCENPEIDAKACVGDLAVSGTLNMPNGTEITSSELGATGTVNDGVFRMQLINPLTKGQTFRIRFECGEKMVKSDLITVSECLDKLESSCSECDENVDCKISISDVQIYTNTDLSFKISSVSVIQTNSSGRLEYSKDRAIWVSDILQLATYTNTETGYLYVRDKGNKLCEAQAYVLPIVIKNTFYKLAKCGAENVFAWTTTQNDVNVEVLDVNGNHYTYTGDTTLTAQTNTVVTVTGKLGCNLTV